MASTVGACAALLGTWSSSVDLVAEIIVFVILAGGLAHLLDVATYASFDLTSRTFRYSPLRRKVPIDTLGGLSIELHETTTEAGSVLPTFFLMCRSTTRAYELFADHELEPVVHLGRRLAESTGLAFAEAVRPRPEPTTRTVLVVAALALGALALLALASYRGLL